VWVEWDEGKAEANRRKHGIDFMDAAQVLHDDLSITIRDISVSEPRVVTIGMDATQRVLVVVATWRGNNMRLISARRATRRERRIYQEGT
jgi:uncharacterized DUF497 family protein